MKIIDKLKRLNGFWISGEYGHRLNVKERYSETKPHDGAVFVSLKEIEEKFGKIIAVMDYAENENDESRITIWTDRYVIWIAQDCGITFCRELVVGELRDPPSYAEKI